MVLYDARIYANGELNMNHASHSLQLKWLGIDTYKEAVVYMHKDCHICRSEGFEAPTRIQVILGNQSIIATLNTVDSNILNTSEVGLSNYAWHLLGAKANDVIYISHPRPLHSLGSIRSKVFGHELSPEEIRMIVKDVVSGRLSDIHIATFLAACAGNRLNKKEIGELTKSMIHAGKRLKWPNDIVVDKHCVGGLPGNRTTLIIVPIVAAFGLTIPKTSSRSVTSPAGTADTMEVLAPVNLDITQMQKVVERENGCLIWGGSVTLSPADDILIGVEHAIDLDGEGQLVASILSKKIAAGSNSIIIDMPVGPTAKVRSAQMAELLKEYLESIGHELGVKVKTVFTDGYQPVGKGIGPALEAKDVLAVLQGSSHAPMDLRERALMLAGKVLEYSPKVLEGQGYDIARTLLESGKAWEKFQAICHAQGGMFEPPSAFYTHPYLAPKSGRITTINNRKLARIAKLAGAPKSKAAGIELLTPVNANVEKGEPLFIVHSQTPGELDYAIATLQQEQDVMHIEDLA